MIIKCLIIFLVITNNLIAQVIGGYVYDSTTNEPIIGAIIANKNTSKAVVSNNYGFYSLQLNNDSLQHITIFYTSYKKIDTLVLIKQNNHTINFKLVATTTLNEVEVVTSANNFNSQQLNSKDIKNIPVILGEADPIKAFQILPGVKQGAEGFGALLIRGGTADQVQYILDDMPLYYVNHLGGFLSVFNVDAIDKVSLYKDHTPASLSGRLSGYFDVRMKEGNAKKWNGTFSTGLIASRLNLNGPILKNKSTLQISARRLNLDLITTPIIKLLDLNNQPTYYFYDLMLKYTHQFNTKHKLSVSLFNSYDKLNILSKESTATSSSNEKFSFNWGNTSASFRLTQNITSQLFLTHILSGGAYNYKIQLKQKQNYNGVDTYNSENGLTMGLKNLYFKTGLTYYLNSTTNFNFGLGYELINSSLGNSYATVTSNVINYETRYNGKKELSHQITSYGDITYYHNSKIKLNLGFNNLLFNTNNYFKNYFQPRLMAEYYLTKNGTITGSYCKNVQAMHLLTNNGVGLPTDIWVSATNFAPPQVAQQFNLGYKHYFFSNSYNLQTSVYYKNTGNLIRFKDGFNLYSDKNYWQQSIETNGKGTFYGIELLGKKETGKLTGLFAYTLSKAFNQFANLNNGNPFYFNYDRRHELNLLLNYNLKTNIVLTTNFYFATGNAITLPKAIYNVPTYNNVYTNPNNNSLIQYGFSETYNGITNYAFYYDGVNKQRSANFNRLDIAAKFIKQKKHGVRCWTLGIYNVYNHHNPFAYTYSFNYPNQQFSLKSISLFQLIPFFNYEFKF
jgi:hypothetical protein